MSQENTHKMDFLNRTAGNDDDNNLGWLDVDVVNDSHDVNQ